MAKKTEVTIKIVCNLEKAQSILAEVLDDNLAFVMTKFDMASKTEDPRFRLNVLRRLDEIVDVLGDNEPISIVCLGVAR